MAGGDARSGNSVPMSPRARTGTVEGVLGASPVATRGHETRRRILTAAVRECEAVGEAEFSLRSVAREVGVTTTTIYRYYESREDLLRAVAAQGSKMLAEAFEAIGRAPKATERLRQAASAYVGFAVAHRHLFQLMSGPLAGSSLGELGEAPPSFEYLIEAVTEAIQEGALRPADPREVARTIAATQYGLVHFFLAGRLDADVASFTATLEASLTHVYEGLRT